MFVYKGAGCTGLAALQEYETLIGRKVDGATDFIDYTSSWSNMLSAANWGLGCWQGKVANLSLSVPMAVAQNDGSPIHELAAGQFNAYYTQLAKSIVSHGFPNAYIRVGWEFNGGWYPWYGGNSPSLWIKGYQQIVNTMRAVPGQHFKFVWNPSLYEQGFYPDQAYPGDAYVDVVATDAYNVSQFKTADPNNRWTQVSTYSWGVNDVVKFAKTHNKPYAFPEWGTGVASSGMGGGDDPTFIAKMAPIVQGSAYTSYWDYNAGDYNSQSSGGKLPASMAAIMAEFGTSTAGSKSSVPVEKNTGAVMMAHAAPFTAAAFTATATGGNATVIQNGPGHYMIIVWTSGNVAGTVKVTLGAKVGTANLYDPSVGATPVKALGSISGTTVTLAAGQPLILAVSK